MISKDSRLISLALLAAGIATAPPAQAQVTGPNWVARDAQAPQVVPFGQFFVSAEVCNLGDDFAPMTEAWAVASTDPTPDINDPILNSAPVPALAPGECTPVSIESFGPGSGLFTIGVLVDPFNAVIELDELDNVAVAGVTAFGSGIDLYVADVTGPPSANQPFSATVTVCNQGDTFAGNVDVALYASTDQTIVSPMQDPTSTDVPIGGTVVSGLAGLSCQSVEVTAGPPGPTGAFYIGAIVDEAQVIPELFEDNNATAFALTGFGFGADLIVSSFDAPPTADTLFSATVRVCNQGTAGSGPSDVTVFASADPTIDTTPGSADFPMSGVPIDPLAPGQCLETVVPNLAPPPNIAAGIVYYMGAAVDEPTNNEVELIESNNVLTAGPFAFGSGPDLAVTQVDLPPSADASFTAAVTVCNQGTAPASNIDVSLYASTDQTVESPFTSPLSPDLFIGQSSISFLDRGRCQTIDVLANAPPGPPGAYYVGAFVDETNAIIELLEMNNLTVAGPMGFGSGPDFVVKATAPVYDFVGGGEQVRVTVCNEGTAPSGTTDVEVFVSPDPIVSFPPMPPNPSDFPLGFISNIGPLFPGQCVDVSQNAPLSSISPAGAYFFVTRIDPSEITVELREDNNITATGPVGLGAGPDFAVRTVTAPPTANMPFQITIEVCNDSGSDFAPPFDLTLYASTDETIEPVATFPFTTDIPIGVAMAPQLFPQQCSLVTADVAPPGGPEGAYFIGAVADETNAVAELLETNNIGVSGPIGFGFGPDLVVASVEAPPAADTPFDAMVTVCNQGTAAISNFDVELLSSADAVIDPTPGSDDFLVGGVPFLSLQPGECRTEIAPNVAPAPPTVANGAYFLGAIADPFNIQPELLETNNETVVGPFGFGAAPDLTVTSVVLPPSADGPFTTAVTVCNQGTVSASDVTVTLYSSADATIETPVAVPWSTDLFVGQDTISFLDRGACRTANISTAPPPTQPGAVFIGAIVDEGNQVAELLESNNLTVAGPMGIGSGPDLVVKSTTPVYDVLAGIEQVRVTVCNEGTAVSDLSHVEIYASPDPVVSFPPMPPNPSDFPITFFSVGPLFPGQCIDSSEDVPLSSISPSGSYFFVTRVDPGPSNVELREDNNITATGPVGLGFGPDYSIRTVTAPPTANTPFQVTIELCNESGNNVTPSVDLTIYASIDETIEPVTTVPFTTDIPIGVVMAPSLFPQQCRLVNADVAPPGPDGAYFIGAVADETNEVAELLETNNIGVSNPIGFGFGPDLVVTNIEAPPAADVPFEAAVTVCNQGTTASNNTDVTVYASADQAIDVSMVGEDFPVGSAPVDNLQPGECRPSLLFGVAPPPPFALNSEYFLGAVVDLPNIVPELLESNNVSAFGPFGFGVAPDLTVTQVVLPPSADGPFTATVRVCNQGTQPSTSAEVTLYASVDSSIESPATIPWSTDTFLGQQSVGFLDRGACRNFDVPAAPPPGPEGPYFVGVFVDESNNEVELIESNNLTVAGPIGFGVGPDIVVKSTSTFYDLAMGTQGIRVEICNEGTAIAAGTNSADIYASVDASVSFPPLPPDPEDFPIGFVSTTGPLFPGQCETVSTPAFLSGVPPGPYFLVANADASNLVAELREDNNVTASGPVGLGDGPDLVARTIEAPPNVSTPFEVTVEVCNASGTQPSPTSDVIVYASVDETIEPTSIFPFSLDLVIGVGTVDSLFPQQCTLVAVPAAPTAGPDGPYFVGAVVDEVNAVFELLETNNIVVTGPVGFGFGPDLVVTALDAPQTSDTPVDGVVTVCNQGTVPAPSSDLTVFASADTVLEPAPPGEDFPISGGPVPPLEPGACAQVVVPGLAPPPPLVTGAPYFLAVDIDSSQTVFELLETNNVSVYGPFAFGSGPDFVVSDVALPPSANGPFTANVTVCNQGTVLSGGVDVTLYASTDEDVASPTVVPWSQDVLIGQAFSPPLDVNTCATVAVPANPPPAGPGATAFFVGAFADESQAVPELLETNNLTVVGPVGFGFGPDLVVRALTVPPVLLGPGQTATAVVCNDGTADSTPTDVNVFASQTAQAQTQPPFVDPWIGNGPVGALVAGQCETVAISVSEPFFPTPVSSAFITAAVDSAASNIELVETNNQRVVGPVGVGSGVELRVASITAPPFASPGQEISSTVQVCNDGDVPTGFAEVRLFASADDTLDTTGIDTLVAAGGAGPINASSCVNVTLATSSFGQLAEGDWFLGAQIDPLNQVPELVETNNALIGPVVQVAIAFCGNGIIDPGEACDDGNFTSGDGCTSQCVVEFCGDGVVNNGGAELCDDGNSLPYDGCSPTCMPQGALLGEVMQLESNQSGASWYPLAFTTPLVNPVVVGHTLSFNGGDPTHLRVRGVTGTGFEWKMEEWAYLDGNHTTETLPFIAVESGSHALEDGTRIDADTVQAGDGWVSVTFATAFSSTPVLLTGVMSDADPTPVVVRVRNLTAQGFEVRVQEEEGQDGAHPAETVAYVAIAAGTGATQGLTFEAARTPDAVRHPWYTIDFSVPFVSSPVFLGNIDTFDGPDTAGLRYRNLSPANVQVKVEEEKSANSETNHTTERVSWTAWSTPGPLVAAP